jgi:hypothetical protein
MDRIHYIMSEENSQCAEDLGPDHAEVAYIAAAKLGKDAVEDVA